MGYQQEGCLFYEDNYYCNPNKISITKRIKILAKANSISKPKKEKIYAAYCLGYSLPEIACRTKLSEEIVNMVIEQYSSILAM